MISSSFFGVLSPGQSFWKDAKIVDRRFSVMSSGIKISHFVGLILSPSVFSASTIFFRDLSERFCNHHFDFHRQSTISLLLQTVN